MALPVDAPVSGGIGGAKAATLTLWRRRGEGIRCGQAGAGGDGQENRALRRGRGRAGGQNLQQHDSGHFHGRRVGEAFALAEKLGLSHQALFDVASTSSGQCWSLTSYCPAPGPVPSPANNDYKPGFAAALMLKDLTLAQDAAKAAGAATPLGAHAEVIYKAFDEAGHGGVDFSGIIQHVRASREIMETVMTTFQAARDFLFDNRTDYDKAVTDFRWPIPLRSTGRWTGSMPNSPAIPTARTVPRCGSSMSAGAARPDSPSRRCHDDRTRWQTSCAPRA